jgi:hypothetical protein
MPSLLSWIGSHALDLLSALGIVSSLAFTAVSFREDTRSRRLNNLVRLTEQHRDIWQESQNNPKLARIRDPKADLYTKPVTAEEAQFVMLLMFHLHCWFRAIQQGEVRVLEGLEMDIRNFLGRPVPKDVWEQRKAYFDPDFRHFVDAILSDG